MNNDSFLNNGNNMDKFNQNNYSRSLYNQNTDNYFEDEKKFDEKPKKGNKVFITIIVFLVIAILGVGIYILFGNKGSNEPIVNFLIDEMSIKVGNNEIISYSVSDSSAEIPMVYESLNEDVAVVNSKGKVFGMKEGKTTVKVTYTINGKDYTKNINVEVTKK